MANLMASTFVKPLIFKRGDKVVGKIVAMTSREMTLDLGAKSEGIISKKDLTSEQVSNLKIGDKLESFVVSLENDSGQIILSPYAFSSFSTSSKGGKWQRFMVAQQRKAPLKGKVIEINRGGLLVSLEGGVGFLPSSQIGFDLISEGQGVEDLIGKTLSVIVIEIDPENNRLILSSRKDLNPKIWEKFAKIEIGQKVSGQVVTVAPFGLLVNIEGLEGVVASREIFWQEEENPPQAGEEIEAVVISKDPDFGRLGLSIRQTKEDPFEGLVQKYQPDDVVEGEILEITPNGMNIKLPDGILGFVPSSKIEQREYQIGQRANFLINSLDKTRRRVNLALFLTSTKGLLYK